MTASRNTATETPSSARPACAGRPRSPLSAAAAAGFTLIEVMVVLVLLSVASVIAIPAVQPALESVRAEAAARRTASFLDEARRRAVLGRKTLEVRCRPREDRLELVGKGAEGKVFRIPEQVALVSCAPGEVRFFPQGSSSGLVLLLRDRRGREHRISVGAFTGLSQIGAAR